MKRHSTQTLTAREHWDKAWMQPIRPSLPSRLFISTLNSMRILSHHIRPDMRFLEIGCAPGKLAAWVAARLKADVTGLDYSEVGIASCRELFASLNLAGRFHCEDLFSNSLPPASFDLVFSNGVIEHFETPREAVQAHWRLLKPGGKALIVIPHYGGIYGRLQRVFDADNLRLHNLHIMHPKALVELIDADMVAYRKAYPAGRLSPGLVSWERQLWTPLATLIFCTFNGLGLIQPAPIPFLCPNLVLEFVRKPE